MSKHQYDIRVSKNCIDQNSENVLKTGPRQLTCFPTQKWCAWELAAYVFKNSRYITFGNAIHVLIFFLNIFSFTERVLFSLGFS